MFIFLDDHRREKYCDPKVFPNQNTFEIDGFIFTSEFDNGNL